MTKLLLMRHAKSDWSKNVGDFDRPINKRGSLATKKMCKWLKKENLVPGLVISSPALRARQTAEIVCEQSGIPLQSVIWDKKIYEASIKDLLNVILELTGKDETPLLIGHNPGLDALVKHLSSEMPPYSETGKLMTTAAIAVIKFEKSLTIRAGSGKLLKLARPKEI